LEAPEAGSRTFLRQGFVPDVDIKKALTAFGSTEASIQELEDDGRRKLEEFVDLDLAGLKDLDVEQAVAVLAYTQENKNLYPVLNLAMRSSGAAADARIKKFAAYIFFLSSALQVLPAYKGKVYRGIDVRLAPHLYEVGKTITWQPFSSTTKNPLTTLRFIGKQGTALDGSLFIIHSTAGKEIEELSVYSYEREVLFKENSFFKVMNAYQDEAAKRAMIPDFGGYDVTGLDIYELKQVG